MRGLQDRIKDWWPVVVVMALIFIGSSDLLSERHTSRILGPVLRWLVPDISDATLKAVQFTLRKLAHVTEYALLAILVWRATRHSASATDRPWSWRAAGWTLGAAALYATTDELHQSLLATRFGTVWDVLIDTCGAALGLLLVWAVGRLRNPP